MDQNQSNLPREAEPKSKQFFFCLYFPTLTKFSPCFSNFLHAILIFLTLTNNFPRQANNGQLKDLAGLRRQRLVDIAEAQLFYQKLNEVLDWIKEKDTILKVFIYLNNIAYVYGLGQTKNRSRSSQTVMTVLYSDIHQYLKIHQIFFRSIFYTRVIM